MLVNSLMVGKLVRWMRRNKTVGLCSCPLLKLERLKGFWLSKDGEPIYNLLL